MNRVYAGDLSGPDYSLIIDSQDIDDLLASQPNALAMLQAYLMPDSYPTGAIVKLDEDGADYEAIYLTTESRPYHINATYWQAI